MKPFKLRAPTRGVLDGKIGPYAAGKAAGARGFPLKSNPYSQYAKRMEWERGWRESDAMVAT